MIRMDDSEATNVEQVRAFLAGSGEVRFAGQSRTEIYVWTERTLVRHQYVSLSRREKGLLRLYVARMTGLSRAQVTRLIASYADTGHVKTAPYQRRKFGARYTKADVELLAYVDKSHGNLSGPATKRIMEREFGEYGQAAYERLAGISVAQIYRFRNSELIANGTPATSRPGPRRSRSASGANRGRRAGPDICVSTLCIKATGTASKASITSTRSTK
jgi:hypothetical protein